MKKLYALLTIAALITLSLNAGCSDKTPATEIEEKPEETPGETGNENNKILNFFTDFLYGKSVTFTEEAEVQINDIAVNQTEVWNAWKEANEKATGLKLIPLDKLDNGKSGSWNLPQSLEPNATMPYYWGSKGTKPASGYPLFLYLHGSGDKETEWSYALGWSKIFNDSPSVYFIPQIPNTGNYYRWWQKAKQYAWEQMLRLAFAGGEIDANKVYFFGISEGGYGSQRLASFYADYLAGAGPMAGGEPLMNAPVENCRNIAFSMLTGANDTGFYRNTLTSYTKAEFEKLKQQNPNYFKHRIELIPNAGHSIDYTLTTPWLKQHTRNPHPKSVSWENFEMDGVYRTGFYNLAVKERSNADMSARTYYEMDINGNNIDIDVQLVSYKVTETDPIYGIQMKFDKTYEPATKGKFIVYLNNELVDLSKDVTLTVNGKTAFTGKVKTELKHLVNSCTTFFDPHRLYPAAIEVDLSQLK